MIRNRKYQILFAAAVFALVIGVTWLYHHYNENYEIQICEKDILFDDIVKIEDSDKLLKNITDKHLLNILWRGESFNRDDLCAAKIVGSDNCIQYFMRNEFGIYGDDRVCAGVKGGALYSYVSGSGAPATCPAPSSTQVTGQLAPL